MQAHKAKEKDATITWTTTVFVREVMKESKAVVNENIFLLVVLEKSWLHPNNQHWVGWAPWTPLVQQGSCKERLFNHNCEEIEY